MPHIQTLDPHVADLIAAGEVVERPASVIKELCENAVDAGAHTVTVEIQNGGMSLIRVTDDGCGIAPEEVQTAFLRHATSKIRSEYDLESIQTLGFRGEALAAIASVSRVSLLTRQLESPLGTALTLEGGVVLDQEEAGCPAGTTMIVRDLFYNTPARLKFMKKDSAESAACLAIVQKLALSHPEVSYKFIRDGRQELLTPGDNQAQSALYAVLGRDIALGFRPVEGSGEGISVSGFTSLPTCCRGSRSHQFFFVNGRYIKSKTMMAALEQAYANQRMVGKFPGCVLYLTIKPNTVDVNVHPTKQEVKFGSERQVFSAVYYAVLDALTADHTRPTAQVSAPVAEEPAPVVAAAPAKSQPLSPPPSAPAVAAPEASVPFPSAPLSPQETVPHPAEPDSPVMDRKPWQPGFGDALIEGSQTTLPLHDILTEAPPGKLPTASAPLAAEPGSASPWSSTAYLQRHGSEAPSHAPAEPTTASSTPASPSPEEELPLHEEQETPWRVAGELFLTYIVVEQGERALLIDKHAAHERMNFDRMQAVDYLPMSQTLLTPVVFTPTPEEAAVLLEYSDELDRLGFELSDFGGGSLAVRSIPDYVAVGEIESTLAEIAGQLSLTGSTGYQTHRDEILHTMACKAAIKGGWNSAPEELHRVAQAVLSGQVKYCPHGRPVAIELTQAQLEKQFKRT